MRKNILSLLALACLPTLALGGDETRLTLKGSGFFQYGRVMHSSDTSRLKYTGNTMRTSGAQLTAIGAFSDRMQAAIGIGVVDRHFLDGSVNSSAGRSPFVVTPYIAQANFTYAFLDREDAGLSLTGGYFQYNYNPDVRNLGLYLLRGPVYPGFLLSGFDARHVAPSANLLGFRLRHRAGAFEQDFILNSETELYPLFDISPAYVAGFRAGGLRVGAGANFYHYLPIEPRITSPDSFAYDGNDNPAQTPAHPYMRTWVYVDTVAGDTTFLSFKGIKLMANASFDVKSLVGDFGVLGGEDLKVYSEIAVIGLDGSKAYKAVYGGYAQRMPVMFGFNVPAFRLLDRLALEVEWYGAKYKDDLVRYQASSSSYMSPLPVYDASGADPGRDDWKWSLYGTRDVGNLRFTFQVANDHSRPGGMLLFPGAEWQALYSTPSDWYWMTKVGFFF